MHFNFWIRDKRWLINKSHFTLAGIFSKFKFSSDRDDISVFPFHGPSQFPLSVFFFIMEVNMELVSELSSDWSEDDLVESIGTKEEIGTMSLGELWNWNSILQKDHIRFI